jgi:integrase
LERGLLQITQTKFKKSRLVPMHPTTTLALRHYRNMRDKRWGVQPEQPFFLNATGRPLSARSIQCVLRQLCEGLGWQRGNGELHKPRIHDLRHSFACRRLLLWHRDGHDIGHRIAALTTYLGHGKVRDTYWYLTGTPELLAIAGDRFGRFVGLAEGSTP